MFVPSLPARWRAGATLAALFVLMASLVAACGGDGDDSSDEPTSAGNGDETPAQSGDGTPEPGDSNSSDPGPTPTPTVIDYLNDQSHPTGTRADDPSLDPVIDAIEAGSIDAFTAQIQFQAFACTADGADAPRCPADVAPGTQVEALPTYGCQPSFTLRDNVERDLRSIAQGRFGIYAAYAKPDPALPGDTVMLLAQRAEGFALSLHLEGGNIVAVTSPCELQEPGDIVAEAGVTTFILEPPTEG